MGARSVVVFGLVAPTVFLALFALPAAAVAQVTNIVVTQLGNYPDFFANTRSLIGDNQGAFIPPAPLGSPDANGNFIGMHTAKIDPKLGPLGDNGGQTPTMPLLPTSPALDTAGSSALTTDQRGPGLPRKIGAQVDMGPFEYDPSTGDTTAPASPRNLRAN